MLLLKGIPVGLGGVIKEPVQVVVIEPGSIRSGIASRINAIGGIRQKDPYMVRIPRLEILFLDKDSLFSIKVKVAVRLAPLGIVLVTRAEFGRAGLCLLVFELYLPSAGIIGDPVVVDIAVSLRLGEDDLITKGGESARGMVGAPIVAVDPDGRGHTSRGIEDDEDVGFNDLADERGYFALHRRYRKSTPEEEG